MTGSHRSARCPPPWSRSATWRATSSGPRFSWPSGWGSRSCSRASQASARPRPPRPWPRRSTPRWSGCSATRASPSSEALYEWNYPRQLLAIRLAEAAGEHIRDKDLFTEEYLLPRPLLTALLHPGPRPAVLLIDEVDRADDEFEAFLFELLAEAAVTIPELGTQQAKLPPVTVLTSNRTRDLHDALKRRCLYHWIAYPDTARVAEIVRRRVPGSGERLAGQIATAVNRLRGLDLTKPPGISEAISWAFALSVFGAEELSAPVADQTLSTVLKYPEDEETVRQAGLAAVVGTLD